MPILVIVDWGKVESLDHKSEVFLQTCHLEQLKFHQLLKFYQFFLKEKLEHSLKEIQMEYLE